jgi:Regulator of ribonuclease activity B
MFGFLKKKQRATEQPTLDEWALDQLKQAGEDLSRPHSLEFQLIFPTQPAAEQAASQIKADGFDVTVKPGGQDGEWLCAASKMMVPEIAVITKIHQDFDGIAASFGGRYDGWSMAAEN